jgi:hypothetical protein
LGAKPLLNSLLKEVVLMKPVKTLFILMAVLLLTSCATSSRVGPEYEAGRIYAYDIAKKDAWEYQCFWYPRRIFPATKAREYTETLKSQGKSQKFVEGFYFGYERTYINQINVKCEE